jgi:hypothetical protein
VVAAVVAAAGAAVTKQEQRLRRRIITPTLRRYSLYKSARKNGVPINTQFLVKLGLSTNPICARKMINRDVHSGILTAIATWPRTYELAQEKNVTSLYAASSSRPARYCTVHKRSGNRAQSRVQTPHFTRNNSNSSSLLTNEDILVHNVDLLQKKRIEQHRERCRRYYRRKRKEKQKAIVYYQEAIINNVAAYMTDTLVLSAASSASGGLSAALHGHNFSFQTFLDDAALASRLSSTYRRIDGSKAFFIDWFMRVGGRRVKNKVYPKSRYVQIQPCMTESPIAIRDLPSFMDDIRDKLLPYLPTPPTDSRWWLLTSIDLHVPDWDVTDQEEKNEEWVKALDAAPILRNLEDGSKFHVYLKRYAGRTYVRMELMQLQPDMTYSEFVATYIDQDLAGKKFSEAILSLLLLLTSQYRGPMESPYKMRH